jgi:hypothetical protein
VLFFDALAGISSASDHPFVERWSRFDEFLQLGEQGLPGYRKKMEAPFTALRSYPGPISVPPGAGPVDTVLVLSTQQDRSLLLATPKNTLGSSAYLGEDFKQELMRCSGDRSWIVALPENTWTPIELSPYCSMDYDEEGILVEMYWTRFSSRPLVDISTNGFKCVSHNLYGWDVTAGAYRLKANKCTGSRSTEHYSLNSPMRQVYPPGGEPQGKSGRLEPWSSE